ncbi:DUF11 domain-containing protein [Curtobacterium sp. MCPF17_002]|uniref:DUF7927 domain-containing protein n=1 Tax=Curtobacterium sp. MCPF17_002 TaxID=2175645 RepID=UPI0015E8B8FD|nr:DUF11 domain-containing protein [Curtobacterium sp. MCPF17_002]WIB76986.1 DUF11 domain-containing protein [Curtobacterium sp. MCPF17_002]
MLSVALAGLLVAAGVGLASPATAAPVFQITGSWDSSTPATVAKGDVLNATWRLNVNDDQPAPSNDPVDNVTFSITLQHGLFKNLPDLCLTTGVDTASAISADGRTLSCNLGTVNQGTAVTVLTPVVADGLTGDQITATGTINGQSVALDPINIANSFAEDMQFGGNTGAYYWNSDTTGVDLDTEWSLRIGKGSEPGPDSVTYRLTVADSNGGDVSVGTSGRGNTVGCGPFNSDIASGNPWSELPNYPADQIASFVDSCTLTEVSPGQFDLTLSGINYDLLKNPTKDSAGAALPTDWSYVASGSLWFHVATNQPGSLSLTSDAPTYTSATGMLSTDLPSNNTTNKAYTLPGSWSASWNREWTGSGGSPWDDSYRVSAGTTVRQVATNAFSADAVPGTATYGNCLALDTRYVTYLPGGDTIWAYNNRNNGGHEFASTVEYYVGGSALLDPNSAQYNPDQFDCGTTDGGWTSTPPADPAAVKAVRSTFPHSSFEAEDATHLQLYVQTTIKTDTPIGQDVWMFGSVNVNGVWTGPSADGVITPTPGTRYVNTNGRRDILRTIFATPSIQKTADRSVVKPGEPANFTLTYAANGAGAIPDTVNGYQIVDTLPANMTYVTGSATPEPTVTTNGSGQQVLTWNLDDVATNAPHALTYQAVAGDAVTPGQVLTNTATSSLAGNTSAPASAQVTVATSGYTTIVKSADAQFIPNVNGDGTGTGSWTVTLRSFDPVAQDYTDTIDILPYNGDGRGTSFSGSYDVDRVRAADGATVYYTTADPASLSDDPGDTSNGAPGTVSGNTVGWTTTYTADATAVRVIGSTLQPGATQAFTVPVTTDGVTGGDTLVNRAQARDEHTALVMRTSAAISVANYYSATLKKEVQDVDGNWHDANDAGDYPTFHYGDTVHYRVIVTNTGQGALTNFAVSDDKNPDAGNFTIDRLEPGESQTHEYSRVLNESIGGSFVNTACGTADTPADSGVAPTIPCDPAGIDIVGYSVVKTSDPASGANVTPDQTINYTITVTQRGSVAADAELHDALAGVTDDATFNDDLAADIGTATRNGDTIDWAGTIPVGGVAKITYSVTVNSAADLADGDSMLDNVVTSEGCEAFADCLTHHEAGSYVFSKTSDPAPGADVVAGQSIDYTVTVKQVGAVPQRDVTVTDDLSGVLDDATWTGNEKASDGTVTRDGNTLTWNGDLAVGQTVTITYTVAVTAAGDTTLTNQVASDAGSCVPASDENPDCTTTHHAGTFTYSKMSDPKSPATVEVGDTVTYTVTVNQRGTAGVPGAKLVDDLSGVLDDATWNDDAKASAGTLTRDGNALNWGGDLAVGQTVTITYTVTVAGGGDTTLENTVTTPPGSPAAECVTAPDGTPGCRTVQKYGGYTFSKTSDPKSGTKVAAGERINYTVTVTQTGDAAVNATVVDNLTNVLDDATWVDNAKASTGTINRDGNKLTWTGRLGVGKTATITYSVTANGDGDGKIGNVVTSPDTTAACVPAADGNTGCATEHTMVKAAAVTTRDPGALAFTGSDLVAPGAALALLLMALGGTFLVIRRRKQVNGQDHNA